MTIKPHNAFNYSTPSDIANCWDEANSDICQILVKGMKAFEELTANENKEDGWCPQSWACEFNMAHASVWSMFDDAEKAVLNAMAERHKIAHDEFMASL